MDNKKSIKESIKSYWQIFIQNYRWSDYVAYIDGWIPKLAFTVPILGYLILFNDKISDLLTFEQITNTPIQTFGFSGLERLRFLYFGLILLGLSNFVYRVRKPYTFKFGSNSIDYIKTCFETFTFHDYHVLKEEIQHKGNLSGRVRSHVIASFSTLNKTNNEKMRLSNPEWEVLKNNYGNVLRDILYEYFYQHDISRKVSLSICLLLSTLGYFCLLLPSGDLFVKVLLSIFGYKQNLPAA